MGPGHSWGGLPHPPAVLLAQPHLVLLDQSEQSSEWEGVRVCVWRGRCYLESTFYVFVVVQLLSHVQLLVIPWTVARQAPLFSTVSQSLCKFMFFESVMLNYLILCHAPPPFSFCL